MKLLHFQQIQRIIATTLALTMLSLTIGTPRLNAMVVPTPAVASAGATVDRADSMASVQAALENKVVRQRLNDMGMSDAEIDQRLAKLSDQQLHQVAMQIDQQTAAGDGGAIIAILVIAILLVVLIRLID